MTTPRQLNNAVVYREDISIDCNVQFSPLYQITHP